MIDIKKRTKALGLFIVILILTFGAITWFTKNILEQDYKNQIEQINKDEWNLLRNALHLYLEQAKVQGQGIVDYVQAKVESEIKTQEELVHALDTYNEPNNYIRKVLSEAVENKAYFKGIQSDFTDGFVVRGNVVTADTSANCASFGSERSFELEMLMHANPALAWEAFNRIANGDVENLNKGAIDRPIFFQFLSASQGTMIQHEDTPIEQRGKLATELSSYDIKGLEEFFLETLSWQRTFEAFEFVTPSYIYNKNDLAGRPYTESGYRTDIPRLSVNIVFTLKSAIDHNPILKRDLSKYESRREELKRDYLFRERILYLVVILLTIICFISMQYTSQLIQAEEEIL